MVLQLTCPCRAPKRTLTKLTADGVLTLLNLIFAPNLLTCKHMIHTNCKLSLQVCGQHGSLTHQLSPGHRNTLTLLMANNWTFNTSMSYIHIG